MRRILVFVAILGLCCNESQEKKVDKNITVHSRQNDTVNPPSPPPPPPPPPPTAEIFKCIYGKLYSDSIRLQFYPFNKYPIVELVSFRINRDNFPVRENSIIQDSLIEKVSLSKKDLLSLTDILYNNYPNGEIPQVEVLNGFLPRNAILFFDSSYQIKESILISFYCGKYEKGNKEINMGEYCYEKLEKLRRLFIAKGVRFGTNLNIEIYPGEQF